MCIRVKKKIFQLGTLSVYLPEDYSFFLLILCLNVCLGSLEKAI